MEKMYRRAYEDGLTFGEIGQRLGISRARAEQIYSAAIRKLGSPNFKDEFMEITDILKELNNKGDKAFSKTKVFG